MQNKNKLNVFYVVDKNYIIPFTVALTSLLENNKDIDLSVFVIHDLGKDTSIIKINRYFFDKYAVKINFFNFENDNNEKFNDFPVSNYISKAAYFRLLLADIIPKHVLSGLYIDCDTIVTKSLKSLIQETFKNERFSDKEYSLLAVSDINEQIEIERINKLGINITKYFNSGVLYVNLKKWREDKTSEKLLKCANEYMDYLKWHDQDVLNIFFRNSCGKLNSTYNGFVSIIEKKTPIIIHYNGNSKPWHYIDISPYKFQYKKYLKLTPYHNQNYEKITIKMIKTKYIKLIKKFLNIY